MLTEEEKEDLKYLLLYASEISSVYEELNNNKSQDGSGLKQKLQQLFHKEEKIYKKYQNKADKLQKMINYFWLEPFLPDFLEKIMSDDSLIVLRVNERFYELFLAYHFEKFLKESKDAQKGIYEKYLNFYVSLDFVKMLLNKLDSYLNNSQYAVFKNSLANFKHRLLFIFHSLEISFVKDNSFTSDIPTSLKENNDCRELNFEATRVGILDLIVTTQIPNLNDNKEFISVAAQIVIESAKEFYTEEEIKELCESINSFSEKNMANFKLIMLGKDFNEDDLLEERVNDSKIELASEDLILLNELYDLTSQIYDIYLFLASLEISNQKGSLEYQKNVKNLKRLLLKEDLLYEKLGYSPKKASNILMFLLGYSQYDLADVLTGIKRNDKNKMLVNRISEHFQKIITEYPFSEEEFLDNDDEELNEANEELIEFIECLSQNDFDDTEEEFLVNSKIDNAVNEDIIRTILRLVEDSKDSESKEVQDYLTRIKYQMLFSFKFLEQKLVKDNFVVPETLVWEAKLVSEFLDNDYYSAYLEDAKELLATDLLEVEERMLLELNNASLEDLDDYVQTLVTSIVFRSCLLFLDKKSRKQIVLEFQDEVASLDINSPQYKDIIDKTIKSLAKDSQKPFILSLKPPK